MRTFLVPALLALAAIAGSLDLFGPDGQRLGSVREGAGGQVEIFDRDSRRIGWGRRNADGSVELFDTRGNRIGEVRGGRIILRDPVLRRGIDRQ